MKQFFILVTVLVSLKGSGQDTLQTHKILIGFNFSPDYSFRALKNADGSSSTDLVINSRNDIEIAKFGYTTGLNLCFNFSQQVGFETGIQFSNKGYKTEFQDLVYIPPDPNSPSRVKTNYSYHYIGIPLKARFSFGRSRVRFLSSIGFMTNFLVNAKQTTNSEYSNGNPEEKSKSSITGLNKVDISPMVSVGIDYKLNNKVHLFAEPAFRYGLIKIKDDPVTENLWNAGLNLGFYYAFK